MNCQKELKYLDIFRMDLDINHKPPPKLLESLWGQQVSNHFQKRVEGGNFYRSKK